jgi:putative salt-induced outer membrane protein YdiY
MQNIILILLITLASNLFAYDDFTHESEASINGSQGNSPYDAYNFFTRNKLKIDSQHEAVLAGHYSLSTINDEQFEIARNWDINGKYLVALSKKLYAFLGFVVEGDEFAGYSERNNIDLGAEHKFIYTDKYKMIFQYGLRQTVEVPIDGRGADKDQKARFYSRIDNEINSTSDYAFWIEYIPNFSTPEDYMINFEPSYRISLTRIFSLKLSYKGVYDNEPAIASRRYFDSFYRTSLLAKF